MTIQVSYPGVYAQLISAPNPPTTGIPTSTTLFVGRAQMGPVETATTINSYDDFKRTFGALDADFPMSYALNQFYDNGGAEAIIVRLFKPSSNSDCIGTASLSVQDPPQKQTQNQDVQDDGDHEEKKTLKAAADAAHETAQSSADAATKAHANAREAMAKAEAAAEAGASNANRLAKSAEDAQQRADEAQKQADDHQKQADDAKALAKAAGAVTVKLAAKSPGAWAKYLKVSVDTNGIVNTATAPQKTSAEMVGLASGIALFNMTVMQQDSSGQTVKVESFVGVTLAESGGDRRLDNALANGSTLVDWNPTGNTDFVNDKIPVTAAGGTALSTGADDGNKLTSEADYTGAASTKPSGWDVIPEDMLFNLMVIPPDTFGTDVPAGTYAAAAEFCNTKQAFLIIDPPTAWTTKAKNGEFDQISLNDLGSFGEPEGASSAVFFPEFQAVDPLSSTGRVATYPPSAYMAGLFAQMDSRVGVWAAAAGLWAPVNNISGVTVALQNADIGTLYGQGINCIKTFSVGGTVPWGARTLRGAPLLADEYNIIPVRRLGLYIEQWVLENTRWAVFRPNDESTWSVLREQVGTFLGNIWKDGGLFGTSASSAYFVKCDSTTTTQADIMAGKMNVQIGYAPVRPAEFVVVTIQQYYGSSGQS